MVYDKMAGLVSFPSLLVSFSFSFGFFLLSSSLISIWLILVIDLPTLILVFFSFVLLFFSLFHIKTVYPC